MIKYFVNQKVLNFRMTFEKKKKKIQNEFIIKKKKKFILNYWISMG